MIRLQQLKAEFIERATQSAGWRHWQQLPPRDRLALTVLGMFFVLVLFYAFVWLPLDRKLNAASARYHQEREFLAYLQEQAPLLRSSAKKERSSLSAEQLQGVITSTAQQHGLLLERLDSDGNGRLQISMAQAPFEKVVRWVLELEDKGVSLLEVGLEEAGVGKVDARLAVGIN